MRDESNMYNRFSIISQSATAFEFPNINFWVNVLPVGYAGGILC